MITKHKLGIQIIGLSFVVLMTLWKCFATEEFQRISTCGFSVTTTNCVGSIGATSANINLAIREVGRPGRSFEINRADNPANSLAIYGEESTPANDDFVVLLRAPKLGTRGQQINLSSPRKVTQIEIRIDSARSVQIRVNGELVNGYRWDTSVLPDFTKNLRYAITDQTRANLGSQIEVGRYKSSLSFGVKLALGSLAFTVAWLLGLMLASHKSTPKSTFQAIEQIDSPDTRGFRQIAIFFLASNSLTAVSVATSVLGLSGFDSYFTRDGVTLARAARFSDWFQLSTIAGMSQPYDVGNSNYPPFGLAVFKAVNFIGPAFGFLITVALSLGAVVGLLTHLMTSRARLTSIVLAVALVVSFYPILFSIERGSSELILLLFFTAFVSSQLNSRPTVSCIFLGLMIALKVFPVVLVLLFVFDKRRIRNLFVIFVTAASATILGSLLISGSPLNEVLNFVQVGTGITSAIDSNQNLAARSTSVFSWLYNLKVFRVDFAEGDKLSSLVRALCVIALLCLFILVIKRLRTATAFGDRVMMMTLLLLIAVPLSNDYRLILLVPALIAKFKMGTPFNRKTLPLLGIAAASKHFVYASQNAMTLGGVFTMPLLLACLIVEISRPQLTEKLRYIEASERLPDPSLPIV
jgi:hypothetical protein